MTGKSGGDYLQRVGWGIFPTFGERKRTEKLNDKYDAWFRKIHEDERAREASEELDLKPEVKEPSTRTPVIPTRSTLDRANHIGARLSSAKRSARTGRFVVSSSGSSQFRARVRKAALHKDELGAYATSERAVSALFANSARLGEYSFSLVRTMTVYFEREQIPDSVFAIARSFPGSSPPAFSQRFTNLVVALHQLENRQLFHELHRPVSVILDDAIRDLSERDKAAASRVAKTLMKDDRYFPRGTSPRERKSDLPVEEQVSAGGVVIPSRTEAANLSVHSGLDQIQQLDQDFDAYLTAERHAWLKLSRPHAFADTPLLRSRLSEFLHYSERRFTVSALTPPLLVAITNLRRGLDTENWYAFQDCCYGEMRMLIGLAKAGGPESTSEVISFSRSLRSLIDEVGEAAKTGGPQLSTSNLLRNLDGIAESRSTAKYINEIVEERERARDR